jgi:ComF family protein
MRTARLTVFLSQCRLCERDLVFHDEDIVCRECKGKISMFTTICESCGWPMENESPLCGECILSPPPYQKHVSYGGYYDELRELILAFKYGAVEKLKHLLTGYYIEVFKKELDGSFDFIIPVPPDRGRKREFNPVLEITKILSKRLGIKLLPRHLEKVKKTLPQAELTRSRRLKNLNAAFILTGASPSLKGKNVLLVDDVYTTGTTIKKCAELLIKADAEVTALTLARSL